MPTSVSMTMVALLAPAPPRRDVPAGVEYELACGGKGARK